VAGAGGITQIEPEGLRNVLANDHTAVVVDVREAQERQATPFPNAQPIPRSAVLEGKDVGKSSERRTTVACPWKITTRVLW